MLISACKEENQSASSPSNKVIVLPMVIDIDKEYDLLIKDVVRNVIFSMKKGDGLVIMAGDGRLLIKEVLPNTDHFNKEDMRFRYFAKNNITGEVTKYIKESTVSKQDSLNVIEILRRLSLNQYSDAEIYIVDSPFSVSKDNHLPMNKGFPSDSYVHTSSEKSPFGVASEIIDDKFTTQKIHWFFSKSESFVNDYHQQSLQRFYALYFHSLKRELCHFSSDVSLIEEKSCLVPDYKFGAGGSDEKMEFNIIGSVPVSWDENAIAKVKPTKITDSLELLLKWECDSDLDLYVSKKGETEELSYKLPVTSFGSLIKDFTQGAAKQTLGWEHVVFDKPINLRDINLHVNYYQGKGLCNYTLKAKFGDQVYSYISRLSSDSGNMGNETLKRPPPFWDKIDIYRMFFLN